MMSIYLKQYVGPIYSLLAGRKCCFEAPFGQIHVSLRSTEEPPHAAAAAGRTRNKQAACVNLDEDGAFQATKYLDGAVIRSFASDAATKVYREDVLLIVKLAIENFLPGKLLSVLQYN